MALVLVLPLALALPLLRHDNSPLFPLSSRHPHLAHSPHPHLPPHHPHTMGREDRGHIEVCRCHKQGTGGGGGGAGG